MHSIKYYIKLITSPQQRKIVKRWRRHIKAYLFGGRKTSLDELRRVLVGELGIKAGDHIFVTSSFGNLNASYSPEEVIRLLMDIITKDGCIMMPFYPPVDSVIWAKENRVFDMKKTSSGTGIITNLFSEIPGVVMSMHPTKAVCVWGKDADSLAVNHDHSTTPYYWDSPYGRFLKIGSKSVGLGVGNMPLIHTMEDVLSTHYDDYHQKNKYRLKIIDKSGEEHIVETYIHDPIVLDKCISSAEYVQINKPSILHKVPFGLSFIMCVDNTELYNLCKEEFARGITRIQ